MSLPVVALLRAKSGMEGEAETMLRGLLGPTHAENGCELYALHRSTAEPRLFVFIEKWSSPEALQAHLRTPHILAGLARQSEVFENLEIISLETLPGGQPSKSRL
jgi:quinol monooxygenase YgiN